MVHEKLNRELVLLLDEFDDTNQKVPSAYANAFYDYLADLLATDIQLRIVVVLARSPESLTQSAKDLLHNAAKIRVPLMTNEETLNLASLSGRWLDWEKPAREEVWRLTKGHPFIAQSLCSRLWETFSPDERKPTPVIRKGDISKALQTDQYDHIVQYAWSTLSPQEQVVVCMLASSTSRQGASSIWDQISQLNLEDFFRGPDLA